jgi:hypothetical protein
VVVDAGFDSFANLKSPIAKDPVTTDLGNRAALHIRIVSSFKTSFHYFLD